MSQFSINLSNQFLVAMPGLSSDLFAGAVIYLCEHNDQGAMGLVINKPIDINLRNLFEKVELTLGREELAQSPVYFGGPVQTGRGFVLHERLNEEGGHYSSTLQIDGGGLEVTTSRDVLEAIAGGAGPKQFFITLGYSGWGAGQLEEEMGRNAWINVTAGSELIFSTPVDQRYDKALSTLGIDPHRLSSQAGHA
jgi:putative transcriptional regulator